MIKIQTYNEIDKQQWQLLIEQSPTATWFQTPEAYEFYAANSEEMTPFVYGIEEDEVKGTGNSRADKQTSRLKAVCIGYVTKEKSALKQFFTRRAIIIGGPLLADDISDEALTALLMAIRQLGDKAKGKKNSKAVTIASTPYTLHSTPIYIETRNFHDYSKWCHVFEQCGFNYQPHLNFHVDCSVDNVLSQMSESRRRQIKKAIKSGVEITEAQTIEEITAFYNILFDLYQNKVKTPLFPFEFFTRFHTMGLGKYLLVKYNQKVIGGIMCPVLNKNTIYEWFVCGLDEEYRNQYPSVMATYAAIEYANTHGIAKFDFMGAGKPNEAYGVRDFKARFGGEQVEHGRYLCVRKPLLYKIGKLAVTLLKKRKYSKTFNTYSL